MTDYDITVGKELLPELLSGQNGLARLIESVLNQVLGAQVSDFWELSVTNARQNV